MSFNLTPVVRKLVGTTIPRPNKSGTLSGHAAGEPFDKHAYALLKKCYPKNTFRQFEFLNDLYSRSPGAINAEQRYKLISKSWLSKLVSRGKEATEAWTVASKFEEKQNDTADIIINADQTIRIIDVKTKNISKDAQPPNIISAAKIASMCGGILDDGSVKGFDIIYLGISWKEEGDNLRCLGCVHKSLFAKDPAEIYINWAAAMQIQFTVEDLPQDYSGSIEEWARIFLLTFTEQARKQSTKMIEKYVTPYLRHIK